MPALASQCEACRQWAGSVRCADRVARFAGLPHCGLQLAPPAAACGACQRDPPPIEHAVFRADDGLPGNALIAAFGFRGSPEVAAALAERGCDQVWELGRRLTRMPGVPAEAQQTWRPAHSVHQAGLGHAERQRQRHRVDAFMVDPRRRGGAASVDLRVVARTPDD